MLSLFAVGVKRFSKNPRGRDDAGTNIFYGRYVLFDGRNRLRGAARQPTVVPVADGLRALRLGRTHLFEKARFGGSYDGSNQVAIQTAPVTYPTGYNMAYLSSDDIFLYGGGYGNIANATGAFVAKLDPDTLKPIWSNQLINTVESGEWDYPGVMSILNDGFLYVIYGHRLAKLHPQDGIVIDQVDLPTGGAAPGDTS